MNVMVIPEDFRKDQFILQPIIAAMMAVLNKPRAKVDICRDPLLGGCVRALDASELEKIIQARPMIDLFILCVDRDNEASRRGVLDALETNLQRSVKKPGGIFLGENAWQELEVWVIAGLELQSEWKWADIRAERDPKERYFEPLALRAGFSDDEDGGRKKLSLQSAKRYHRILKLCAEDLGVLHTRVKAWLEGEVVPSSTTASSMLRNDRR